LQLIARRLDAPFGPARGTEGRGYAAIQKHHVLYQSRVDCGRSSAEVTIALRADDLVLQRRVVAMVCHHPR
jgi:hypothetical protein